MDETLCIARMRESLSRWVDLGEREWTLLRDVFRYRALERSGSLLSPEKRPREVIFVGSGLLRYYYLGPDGSEANKVFVSESMFIAPLIGCPSESPPLCGMEALEPSRLLVAAAEDFDGLFDKHPIFDRLGRKYAEWWAAIRERQTRAFQLQHARDRYLDFIRVHGDLAQRIPQYHIASYLGITDVSLSRIRRELSRSSAASAPVAPAPAAPAPAPAPAPGFR